MLPKLFIAGDLSYSSRSAVPHTPTRGPATAKLLSAESGRCAWNSECSVGRRTELTTTMLRDELNVGR